MAKIPETIGKYKILSLLGSGGSSIVYLGLHPTLKRKVVLKKLNLRGKKSFYDRFVQEAALMMDLNHDHIVKVYDHFKEGSRHYMVMEFIEGASLDQIIESGGPLNKDTIRYVLRCCCKALSYIHSRNIIHRDIKPSNIFISTAGEVKLGDFGIAMLDNPEESETAEGKAIMGTPSYMAPEQFNPHGRISNRTDIYALGVSYYELLTGEKLFYGDSLEELQDAVLKGRHAPLFPVFRNHGLPVWWSIRRSTFRKPFLRYRKAENLSGRLSGFRQNDSLSVQELSRRSGGGGRTESRSIQKSFDFDEVLGRKKRGTGIIGVLSAAIVLVLLFGAAASWKTGLLHRYLFPRRFGAFSISFTEREKGDSFPFESLLLFRGDESRGELIEAVDLRDDKLFFRRSSMYRMQLRWGNRVEWYSFFLPPLSSGGQPRNIDLQAPVLISQPVNLTLTLVDALTGEPLDPRESFYIQNGEGEWLDFDEGSLILSGNTYHFKSALPGYYEREFSRTLRFFENELILHEELMPLPGKLVVHHNMERLGLKVDGRRTIIDSGGSGNVLKFGQLDMEGESWMLPPGVYQLQWTGRFSRQNQKLTVRSGEIVIYRITADKEGEPVFSMDRQEMTVP